MKISPKNVTEVEMIKGIYRKTLGHKKELMLAHFRLVKGTILPLHSHPHVQAGFVLSGKIEFQENNQKYILETGDSYIIDGNVEHGAFVIEDTFLIDCFSPRREDYL